MKTKLNIIICGLALVFAACSTTKKGTTIPNIGGTEWKLQSVMNQAGDELIVPDPEKIPTLTFSADEKMVAGFGGCNSYSGPVTIKYPTIKFGALMATKMMCVSNGPDIEAAFFKALATADSYSIKDGELRLIQGERVLAIFGAQ